MARKFIIAIALIIALGLSGMIGYQLGIAKRAKEPPLPLSSSEQLEKSVSRGVHLGLSLRKERLGDHVKAADLRNRILLVAMAEIDDGLESSGINVEQKERAESVLRELVEDVYSNPDVLELLLRDATFGPQIRKEFETRFDKYRAPQNSAKSLSPPPPITNN